VLVFCMQPCLGLSHSHIAASPETGVAAAADSDREEALVESFHELTNHQPVAPTTIPVQMGRKLQIDKAGAVCKLTDVRMYSCAAARSN
jgi:hypothetical protein